MKLKDIAEVEVGSEFVDIYSNKDGHPSASLVLKQSPGSNASKVIDEVKLKLQDLKKIFLPALIMRSTMMFQNLWMLQ